MKQIIQIRESSQIELYRKPHGEKKKKQKKLKAADQIQTQTFPILPTQRICFPNLKPLETTIYKAVSQNKKQILPRT